MITAGNEINTGGEYFLSGFRGDAGAASGIFAIGDHQVDAVLLPQSGDEFPDRAPARGSYDVRDKQEFHRTKLTPQVFPASGFKFSGGMVICGSNSSST